MSYIISFKAPFKCTVDTKLCTFRESEVETLLHLFCGCTITASFWNRSDVLLFIWVEKLPPFFLVLNPQDKKK